jgi:hypothetical protein
VNRFGLPSALLSAALASVLMAGAKAPALQEQVSAGSFSASQPDVRQVVFTDVTAASGITFKHAFSPEKRFILESMSGGVGLIDFNRDGRLDIYFVNAPTVATASTPRSARSELWKNNGDGTYTDVTDHAGVGEAGWGMGVATGDYDNDGWEDLFVSCFGPDKLYRNNHDGTFTDVTAKAGVSDPRWSTGAAFADYDNDGRLDLFVANYVEVRLDALPEFGRDKTCQYQGLAVQCGPRGLPGSGDALFHNNGDGTFTDVARAAGVADPSGRFGMSVAWCDVNDDGHVDLYVANDTGPNFLYRNNGNGTFTDVGLSSGTALSENGEAQASMGVAVGDVARRGRWSIFVTNFSEEYNAFYGQEKDKAFQFTDASYATQTAKASLPFVGWGAGFFDYDNDGWLDLLVANGHVYPQVDRPGVPPSYRQRKLLYRNRRDGTFSEIGQHSGSAINAPGVSRGAAFGDLDNDGDLDVVIGDLDGAPSLLRNEVGSRNNFLIVDLVGTRSNRSAFGARVTVTSGDLVQAEERRSSGSYLSQNDTRLHFGLEQRTRVAAVQVRWPSGVTQELTGVPANAFITIAEGEPGWRLALQK